MIHKIKENEELLDEANVPFLERYTEECLNVITRGIDVAGNYAINRSKEELIDVLKMRFPIEDFTSKDGTVKAYRDILDNMLRQLCYGYHSLFNLAIIRQLIRTYNEEKQGED